MKRILVSTSVCQIEYLMFSNILKTKASLLFTIKSLKTNSNEHDNHNKTANHRQTIDSNFFREQSRDKNGNEQTL